MNNIFLTLVFLLSLFPSKKLNLKYCYTQKDFPVERLQSQNFIESDYISSFSKDGYLWIEADIPENIKNEDLHVLVLGPEQIYEAALYVQKKNLSWEYIGKTGAGVKMFDKSIPTHLQAITFNGENYRSETNKNLKIRLRIISSSDTLVTVSLMNSREFFNLLSSVLSKNFFLLGICLIIIIYNFYSCLKQKEFSTLFLVGVSLLLLIDIAFTLNIPGSYIFPVSHANKSIAKLRYFILCGSAALTCLEISFNTKKEYSPNSELKTRIENASVYFFVSIITVGMILVSLPIPYHFIKPVEFTCFTICLMGVYVFDLIAVKFSKFYNKTHLLIMDKALLLLWLDELFHLLRFNPKASIIFHLIDNKPALSFTLAFFLIGLSTILSLTRKQRRKFAYLQVQTGEAEEKIAESKKWSFIYNNLSGMIANPLQSVCNRLEKSRDHLMAEEYNAIRRSILFTIKLSNSISILSIYEHSPKEILFDSEPMNLNTMISETISPELSTLRINGCFPKIQEKYVDSPYVYTNKALLSVALKFILQTVTKQVFPKTTVNITSEYENLTFIFTVMFECNHVSSEVQNALLNLESSDPEDFPVSKVLEDWGIQLYIANKIVSLLKGSLVFHPGINGASIQMRLALKPLSSQYETPFVYEEENSDEGNSQAFITELKPKFNQTLFIVEEDSVLRKELFEVFNGQFALQLFANTQGFEVALENTTPDLILFSLSTPGVHLLEILDNNPKIKNAPIMVMSKFISRKMKDRLYEKGVFEVIQKPFDITVIKHRITSILLNRLNFREKILSSITDSLRTTLFQNDNKTELNDVKNVLNLAEQAEEVLDTLPVEENDELIMNAVFVSANLTKKEAAIAKLIVSGKTDKEISAELGISTGTVAVHNKNIYKKLNVHSRKELSEKLHK